MLPAPHLCILMGFCLVAYVDHNSDDEGCVSEDASSHAKIAEIYVEKLLVLEGNQTAKLVDHRIRVNVHYHAATKLDLACHHILSCCIPHR